MLFRSACVSLFIFILDDLPIGVSEVLKTPTITVLLSISSFIAFMLGAYILRIESRQERRKGREDDSKQDGERAREETERKRGRRRGGRR